MASLGKNETGLDPGDYPRRVYDTINSLMRYHIQLTLNDCNT